MEAQVSVFRQMTGSPVCFLIWMTESKEHIAL